MLYNHVLYLISKHFIIPKGKPITVKQFFPIPLPPLLTSNYQSIFCLYRFYWLKMFHTALWWFLKVKHRITIRPSNPLYCVFKTDSQTEMLISDQCTNQLWDVHTMKYYSALNRNEILIHATIRMKHWKRYESTMPLLQRLTYHIAFKKLW